MNSTAIRLAIIIVLVLVAGFIYTAIGAQGLPETIRSPAKKLADAMPPRLGQWTGERIPMTDAMFEATDSSDAETWLFRDIAGHTISVHMAVVTEYFDGIEHHPLHCSQSQGYERMAEVRSIGLVLPDKSTPRAALIETRREGQNSFLLYWYHLGDETILNQDEQREARWGFRGQAEWPPLIKVLMQTSAAEPVESKDRLIGFAELLREWTNEFNDSAQAKKPVKPVKTAK